MEMSFENLLQYRLNVCQSMKKFNKVFGIGANKTATTSLGTIFTLTGLRAAPQEEGELCNVQAHRGNLKPLVDYINQYDAFQDSPFSMTQIYAQVDALFPNSKFILTYRDPEAWYTSLTRYLAKRLGVDDFSKVNQTNYEAWDYIYQGYPAFNMQLNLLSVVSDDLSHQYDWSLLHDKEFSIAQYVSRNKGIVAYFAERPNDLLVIDITKEEDTRKIVEFLELPPILEAPVPHRNPTSDY